MLQSIESVILFVSDIHAAASWYAEIFGREVLHENEHFAYIEAPGVNIGFHPADEKSPGGERGATPYWNVNDLKTALEFLIARGAKLYRGPAMTTHGAGVAMLIDPFGCTIGLNQPKARPK
jgi:predicted enzyme related to lactoylglutathione lyase